MKVLWLTQIQRRYQLILIHPIDYTLVLTIENHRIARGEKPEGVIVQFGGQTQ